MNIGVLFSGGKDSTYALHWAHQKGWNLKCLISLQSENPNSYMFHTPNIHLVKFQAQALDLPLIYRHTKGVKEEELEDLFNSIKEAKEKFDLNAIMTGAVASVYQKERVEKICSDLDLKCFSPLWDLDQEVVLNKMLNLNFDIRIVAVAADGLNKDYLGKQITPELIEDFQKKQEKGFHPAGEGGEFESLVVDAPLFKSKLIIKEAEPIMEAVHTGFLNIKEVSLLPKA